jgi:Asp-tRNA(Asn)/Glu-tRNA(Gln) amidotransferase A subunit family amidase
MSALEACGYLARAIEDSLESCDALLMPTAPTTAPAGLTSTGSSIFCAPASYAGLPAIALPSGLGDGGLPLSVQLVAGPHREASLLRSAGWVEGILDFRARPGLAE